MSRPGQRAFCCPGTLPSAHMRKGECPRALVRHVRSRLRFVRDRRLKSGLVRAIDPHVAEFHPKSPHQAQIRPTRPAPSENSTEATRTKREYDRSGPHQMRLQPARFARTQITTDGGAPSSYSTIEPVLSFVPTEGSTQNALLGGASEDSSLLRATAPVQEEICRLLWQLSTTE